jgi:hypothetical protein
VAIGHQAKDLGRWLIGANVLSLAGQKLRIGIRWFRQKLMLTVYWAAAQTVFSKAIGFASSRKPMPDCWPVVNFLWYYQ